jgi:hypothetical protein
MVVNGKMEEILMLWLVFKFQFIYNVVTDFCFLKSKKIVHRKKKEGASWVKWTR